MQSNLKTVFRENQQPLKDFVSKLNKNKNDPELFTSFRTIIYDFYQIHKRPMPWRDIDNPYAVLVSEIMLQQTQVDRVMKKYSVFIEAFPDIRSLAHASFEQLFAVWHGLGYNRRALFLHQCSKIIVEKFNGVVPDIPDVLETLPGLGRATACSISVFAYNLPQVFIETNIRSVYLAFFFPDTQGVTDKQILPFVEKTLDYENPRQWYYALMDYGVMLKKNVKNPSQRSAHHQKQSPFIGSFRQIRGAVLKQLAQSGMMSKTDLFTCLPFPQDKILSAVTQLESEGFISCREENILFKPKSV